MLVRDRCLIIYHVPKTAGQTLTEWAERKAGLKVWRQAQTLHHGQYRLSQRERQLLAQADVIIGHFSPAPSKLAQRWRSHPTFASFLKAHNFTRRCHQWTLLREPRARVASALFFHNHRVNASRIMPSQLDILLDCFDDSAPRCTRSHEICPESVCV